MQIASQLLNLQCAVAHTDMTLETGPTKVLPYSHQFAKGYIAGNENLETRIDARYNDFIAQHSVQNPLSRGDAILFNPAMFHATGENHTQAERVAHLCQVSSGLGVSFEVVNRQNIARSVWPVLKRRAQKEGVYGVKASKNGQVDAYGLPKLPVKLDAVLDLTLDNSAWPINLDRTGAFHSVSPYNNGIDI
jgi:ectoine hydroxylase-related dioxygenase (phytanoyl-CoA dioxygenase family)